MKPTRLLRWYKMFRSWGNSRIGSLGKALLIKDGQRVYTHPVGFKYKETL